MTLARVLRSSLLTGLVLAAALTLAAPAGPASASAHRGPTLSWRDTPTGSNERFRGLSAVSASTAWVSGTHGTVLRTTDGGQTWQDVSPRKKTKHLQFRDIEAFDNDRAVILAIGEGTDSRVYRTTDGGRTWQKTFTNDDPAAFYDCMSFWDDRHGLALSDPVDGRFRVLATGDGGRSWRVTDPSGMPAALPGEFAFAASGTCLVTGGKRDAWLASGGGATSRVYHSTDRGRTWTVTDTPVASSDAGGIFSLAVRGTRALVAVGGDYLDPTRTTDTSAYSHDAGATWAAGGDLGGYRSGAAWLPVPGGVVAVGPTGTDASFDAGRTWAPVDPGSLDSVECAADGACWGSGEHGRVAVLTGL